MKAQAVSPPPAVPYPDPRYAAYVVVLFFLAAILSYTDRLILNLLVDPIRREFGIGDTDVSLLQGAAFAVLYALVGLPLGRAADRFNRRNLILAGVLIWSAATAACGLSRGFGGLFAARIAVGLGEAALAPAVMSMIPDYFPPHRRGAAIGAFLTGMSMGGGAAVIAGGALLQGFDTGALALPAFAGHLAPWREVLVALSLPGVLVAALLLTVREPARQESVAAIGGGESAASLGAAWRYFFRNRWTFGCLFGAFALSNVVGYGGNSWLPAMLMRRFALSPAQVGGSIGAVSLVCAGAGAVSGGFLYDLLQRSSGPSAGLRFAFLAVLGTIPLLAYPLAPRLAEVLTLYGALAFVSGMAGTAGLTAIQNAVPSEMRGLAVSMQAFLYTLIGLGLGPTLVALATDHLYRDPRSVGWSIATVSIPTALVSAWLLWRALPHYRATRGRLAGEPAPSSKATPPSSGPGKSRT